MSTKIEWADETWNPVTGCYGPNGTEAHPNLCPYCYAARMAKRLAGRYGYPATPREFAPTFHADKLEQPRQWKKPRRIFVCSMGDLFGDFIPHEWVERVFEEVRKNPQHTFMFLTKWPQNLAKWDWPANAWAGVTATGWGILERANIALQYVNAPVRFVSAEPWLSDWKIAECAVDALINTKPIRYDKIFDNVDWLIVGEETGPGRRRSGWYERFQSAELLVTLGVRSGIPVFVKPPMATGPHSLVPLLANGWPQEFPDMDSASLVEGKTFQFSAEDVHETLPYED